MKLIFIILNLIALSHLCSCSNSTMLSESLAKAGSNCDSQKYYSYGNTYLSSNHPILKSESNTSSNQIDEQTA